MRRFVHTICRCLQAFPPRKGRVEYVVELESPGGRIRVALKGAALDWASLLHAWREAAR